MYGVLLVPVRITLTHVEIIIPLNICIIMSTLVIIGCLILSVDDLINTKSFRSSQTNSMN